MINASLFIASLMILMIAMKEYKKDKEVGIMSLIAALIIFIVALA